MHGAKKSGRHVMPLHIAIGFFGMFTMTVLMVVIFRRFAFVLGLVDTPDHRKVHDGLVPLCGGLAIFGAFAIYDTAIDYNYGIQWYLAVALMMLVGTGFADDRWRLPVAPRLAVQICAAAILVFHIPDLLSSASYLLDTGQIPAIGWLLTVFAIVFVVGLINATNMIDGADGLAGGIAASSLFWLALIATHTGRLDLAEFAMVMLAGVLGFLTFNMRHKWRSRASVFMGDAGSTALGATIAYLVIDLASGPNPVPLPILLWTIILPITDMASLMVRRRAAGRSPMTADRWHFHHLLIDRGLSHTATSGLMILFCTVCGFIGWLGVVFGISAITLTAALVVPVVLHTLLVAAMHEESRQFKVPSPIVTASGEAQPKSLDPAVPQ